MTRTKLDLNLLPVACVLFEQRSVSRAAEKLGISQPAVSRALKRMRDSLGDPLFVKSREGVEPTAKAILLVACARDVLARVQDGLFASPEFSPATYDGKFFISSTEAAEYFLWPDIFSRLRKLAPKATYRLLRLSPASIPRELESGGVDLCLGYFPTLHGSNLVQQGLVHVRPTCLLRADHPIRGRKLTLKQFSELGHVVVDAIGRNLLFEQVLAEKKIQRKVVLTTSGYASLLPIISTSDLVVTVPRGLGKRLAEVSPVVKTIEPPVGVPSALVAQYWHRKYHNNARNQWLRSAVKAALAAHEDD